jgi:tetratricopeptide (TPR) repeat protein/tRNA A-37 threonylcarbamoyl transferase component Bud32
VAVSFPTLQEALAQRYTVVQEIGRGGMATVYLARDLKHSREVAVKVLDPEVGVSLGADRFLREIRVIAQLQHPHILPLFDSGQVEEFFFYVMPFVKGGTLRTRLQQGRVLPLAEAVRIATEVASGLDYAHRHGIIHRDIKPENILLHDSHAILSDFGVARAISAAAGDGTLTQSGVAVGTAAYMSPEQAAGESELDGRTDVYSLGCLLYEMLAGEPPFTGPTAQVVISRRFVEDPPLVRRLRHGVPESIEHAIVRALARQPADRFASATQFGEAIAEQRFEAVPENSSAREHAAPIELSLLCSRARQILERRDQAQFETARAQLERALALDDRSADAHALLGAWHALRADLDADLEASVDSASRAARRALELEPRHPIPYAVLGLTFTLSWQWREAERAFQRALGTTPTSSFSAHWFAIYATARGRLSEAHDVLTRALQQSPSTSLRFALSTVAYYARDFDAAIRGLRALVRDDPGNASAHVLLGLALSDAGCSADAIHEYERSLDIAGEIQPFTLTALGCTLAASDRRADAEEAFGQLEALARRADISPFYSAALSAALGDPSNALIALKRAFDRRDSWLLSLKVHPWMECLRGEESFNELLRNIGL